MTGSPRNERLFTGYSGRLLVAVSIGWGVMQGGRLVMSPLLPTIKADLAISNTEAGFIFTMLWGLYALLQYPSGRLSDRLTRKTLLVAGLGLAGLGFVGLALAPTYLTLIAAAAVVGVGVGLYPTAARALISDVFVERRGQAFGLHTASGDIGGVAAAGLATVVLAVAVWRAAFLPVVLIIAMIVVALHRWSREDYRVERVDLAVTDTLSRLLGTPRLRTLLFGYALFAITWQSTTAFLPTFLQVAKGFPPAIANAGFGALFLVGATVKPIAGWLGDRWSNEIVAPGALLVGAITLAVVILVGTPAFVIAGVVVFAAGLMAYPPVMQAFLMDTFPTESMGGDLGGMRTIYIGLGALGPTVVGAIADYADYTIAFTGLVGCLLVSSAVIFLATR